jgi:hypothetical protein
MSACDDCHNSFFRHPKVTMAPMLHDHVWGQLARFDEVLCDVCMFKRARDRRIKLSLADLRPCLSNLEYTPRRFWSPWFEFFAKDESEPPENLAEWVKALRQASPKLLQWMTQAAE